MHRPPEPGAREGDDALSRGVALFNRGAFFEAHEILEDAWRALPAGSTRTFYQGLIQFAVAIVHHQRGRAASALTLLARARPKLEQAGSPRSGIDVAALLEALSRCERHVALHGDAPFEYPRIPLG